jgi:hypothetical protein
MKTAIILSTPLYRLVFFRLSLSRTARFYDMADVKKKKLDLEKVVKVWIEAMDKIK